MTKLPDKPSALIRLALDDLEKVERDERYVVNMEIWHEPNGTGRCHVCLAGAVMAGSLGESPDSVLSPDTFSDNDQEKLRAIDRFRTGKVHCGLDILGFGYPTTLPPSAVPSLWYVPDYEDDTAGFDSALRAMADKLEECGL